MAISQCAGAGAGSGVRAFRLGGSGLERVFGGLEASIMEALWKAGEASVQGVCDALGPNHNYKTVMTVLTRLVEKRLLSRRRISKAFLYSAVESREAFLDRVSRGVVTGLVLDFGPSAIAQFVDVVGELAPEELAKLEVLIHRQIGRGEELLRQHEPLRHDPEREPGLAGVAEHLSFGR